MNLRVFIEMYLKRIMNTGQYSNNGIGYKWCKWKLSWANVTFLVKFTLHVIYICHALWKGGLMHMRQVLSQISLCSPHRFIRENTFCFNNIFRLKKVFFAKIKFRPKVASLISLCRLHRLIWDDTLRPCIKSPFLENTS